MEVFTAKLIDLSDDDQDTEGTSASLVQQQATDSPGSNGNKGNSFQGIDLLTYGPIVKYAPEQLKTIRDDHNWTKYFWTNLADKLPLIKMPFKIDQADINYKKKMRQRKKTANVGTSTADLMTSPQSEDISGQLDTIRNLHVESMAKTEKKKAAAKKARIAKTTTSSERGKEEKKKKKKKDNDGNGEGKEKPPIEERENVPPPSKQQAEKKFDKKEAAGDSSTLQSSYQTCSSGENGETVGQIAGSFGAAKPRQFYGRSHNRI